VRTSISRAVRGLSIAAAIGAAACGTLASSAYAAPAGNPLAKLTANQIAKKAIADLKSASSFHYWGSDKVSGQTYSISLSVTGKGCTGWLGLGNQGSAVIMMIGTTGYVQPDDKFWESSGVPAADLPAVHGKWIETTGTGGNSFYAAFSPLCNGGKLISGVLGKLPNLAKGKTIKISRHPALQLRNKSGSESIYVSVSSKPEILRISYFETINFSAYGARVTLTPPPPGDVIPVPTATAAIRLHHLLTR
jgi:hypothetical protein